MSKEAKQPVKSTETTFEIIEALMDLDGAGVIELANYLDLPKSNVHNYLSTLRQEEYVVKEESTYDVGVRFLELGAFARNRMDVFSIAKPEIDDLARETGELSNLLVEEYGRGSYLHRARGDNAEQIDAYTGTRVNLHNIALEKAILAYLPEDRRKKILDIHGFPASTDRTTLYENLDEIRERGYTVDDEQ